MQKIIKFSAPEEIPQNGADRYVVQFNYEISGENNETQQGNVQITVTDVIQINWGWRENGISNSEKIKRLFPFAKQIVINGLKEGTLMQEEQRRIGSGPDSAYPFNLIDLIEPDGAIFPIE